MWRAAGEAKGHISPVSSVLNPNIKLRIFSTFEMTVSGIMIHN